METYIKIFTDDKQARAWMKIKNQVVRRAGKSNDVFVLVDGPDNDFAVVDIDTAINMDARYEWAV